MTDSTASSFNGEDSPESDHNVSLNAALSRCSRGGSWVDDARMSAQRCLDYLKAGVGLKPGVQASSRFVCELGWGDFDFMQELFDAYVEAGHMRLDEQQSFPSASQALPLEAAILNGNISAVEACIRHGNIRSTLSQPWAAKDGTVAQTLEELADLGCRPGMREPIKAAVSGWRAREEALQAAEAMRDVISRAASPAGAGVLRRSARAGV
jgi:hypothetical protein